MTISNMAIEVGAKAGLMEADAKTLMWFEGRGERVPAPVSPDADAVYASELTYDADAIGPQVAKPHSRRQRVSRSRRSRARRSTRASSARARTGVSRTWASPRPSSRAARSTPTCASSSRRRAGRSCSTPSRPATSRRWSRPAPRSSRRAAARASAPTTACRPTARTSSRPPTATSRAGWATQRVHLPRQPGHRGRERHRGQHHRPAQVLRREGGAQMSIEARAIKFGDDINTDYIISGKYKFKSNDMEAMAVHAMEDVDPHYYEKAKPKGAFLVAGSNFGMGSSREQAPLVLIHSNTKAVLAKSFARIFYRNAINTGLPVVECDTDLIDDGDELTLDLEAGVVARRHQGNHDPVPAAAAGHGAAARRRRARGALQEARRVRAEVAAESRPSGGGIGGCPPRLRGRHSRCGRHPPIPPRRGPLRILRGGPWAVCTGDGTPTGIHLPSRAAAGGIGWAQVRRAAGRRTILGC